MADEDGTELESGVSPAPPAEDELNPRQQQIVEEARERLSLVTSVESEQRDREVEDEIFYGRDQWDPEVRALRRQHVDSRTGTTISSKPTLEADFNDVAVQQMLTDARSANLGVIVHARASLAPTEASMWYGGLIRRIQKDSNAETIRMWALERALTLGRGYYRVKSDYVDDEPTSPESAFDQRILIERILDQGTVYWDPHAQRSDNMDARWCIITTWMAESERKRRWPEKPVSSPDATMLDDDGQNRDPWYTKADGGKDRSVRIAYYYRIVEETSDYQHKDEAGEVVASRPVRKRKVEVVTLDGHTVLEETEWGGRYIPVVTVIGKEYYVEGEHIWKGFIRKTRDLSRGINLMISSCVEMVARMPRAPYIMAEGADEDHEEEWDQLYTENQTRIHYKPASLEGKPVPPPMRQDLEPQIQGLMALVQQFRDVLMSIQGAVDPSSRASYPYDRSGRALEELRRQGQAGNANYIDNLANVSLYYEGTCVSDAIPIYYDRAGRLIYIQGGPHDDDTPIVLKTPFVRGPEGRPMPVPCPVCEGTGQVRDPMGMQQVCPACRGMGLATKETMPEVYEDSKVHYVDFGEDRKTVEVSAGRLDPAAQTEAVESMVQLASYWPEGIPYFADVLFRSMNVPALSEVADRIQRALPQAQSNQEGERFSPQAEAMIEGLNSQLAEQAQTLEEAMQIIRTDEVKTTAVTEQVGLKTASAERIAALKMRADGIKVQRQGAQQRMTEGDKGMVQQMLQRFEHRQARVMERVEQAGREQIQRMKTAGDLLEKRVEQDTQIRKARIEAASRARAAEARTPSQD